MIKVLVLQDIGDNKIKRMPPQNIIYNVKRDVDPEYAYVDNQTLPLHEDIPIEVFTFYVQMKRFLAGIYRAILITGKDILINEFQYVTIFKLSVRYVPVFTNKHTYIDFEIDFKENIKKQADRLLKDLRYIFEYARQLDNSPFSEIWFR